MAIESNNTLKFLEQVSGTKLTLGKLINSIRLGEELPEVEFATKLGNSRLQLCDIEHDRKTISPKLAAQYAAVLGYSVQQFIRLSLQSIVDRDNLDVEVDIKVNSHLAYAV